MTTRGKEKKKDKNEHVTWITSGTYEEGLIFSAPSLLDCMWPIWQLKLEQETGDLLGDFCVHLTVCSVLEQNSFRYTSRKALAGELQI